MSVGSYQDTGAGPIDYTEPTSDVRAWLDARYPEGDVVLEHTSDCDRQSTGDECAGGCAVLPTDD